MVLFFEVLRCHHSFAGWLVTYSEGPVQRRFFFLFDSIKSPNYCTDHHHTKQDDRSLQPRNPTIRLNHLPREDRSRGRKDETVRD
jgi:hypothetical protein